MHGVVSANHAHHLHPSVALDLCSGLFGVPLAPHLVQDDAFDLDAWIIVHVALDQSRSAAGDAAGIHHENNRRLQHLGDLRRASQVAVVSLVKAAHPFDHGYVRSLCGMGVDLRDRCGGHEVAVQVAAVPAGDPGVVAGIDVVHGHLEGLNFQAAPLQGKEQSRNYCGLAAGASISGQENPGAVGLHSLESSISFSSLRGSGIFGSAPDMISLARAR
ncbi:Uncharacterised protein [uncultured archaeon]|nr:Uncharacterised protein [uncultured archaeon]